MQQRKHESLDSRLNGLAKFFCLKQSSKDQVITHRGAFKNYAETYSKSFILAPRSTIFITSKINYCQLFVHVTIDFTATISKLWLLKQRQGKKTGSSLRGKFVLFFVNGT